MDDALRHSPVCIARANVSTNSAASRAAAAAELEPVFQRSAVAELQRDIRQAVMLADFVDLHDIRMAQMRYGFRLGVKTRQLLRIGMDARADHLKRDEAIEVRLPRLVDDAHAAFAEFLDNLEGESGQSVAGHRSYLYLGVGPASRGGTMPRVPLGSRDLPRQRRCSVIMTPFFGRRVNVVSGMTSVPGTGTRRKCWARAARTSGPSASARCCRYRRTGPAPNGK